MIYQLNHQIPKIGKDAYVAPSADVIGSVILEAEASVWFGAVLRGDNDVITVGARSNVQDNSVIHVDKGVPVSVGSDVSIGHSVVIHGALVTPGKIFPARSLIVGAPARVARELNDEEIAQLRANVDSYLSKAKRYRSELAPVNL